MGFIHRVARFKLPKLPFRSTSNKESVCRDDERQVKRWRTDLVYSEKDIEIFLKQRLEDESDETLSI